MIGYYVHHQGSGHLRRMQAVQAEIRDEVVVLSSLPRPPGHTGEWVELERDDLAEEPVDVDAHGALHWVPRHDAGLRRRAAQLVGWIDRARPRALVVDVSVEVAALARLCGVPVVVVAMPGDRRDRAHRLAHDLADALVAAWPAAVRPDWPEPWLAKTTFVGGVSGFDRRPRVHRDSRPPGTREVLLLCGSGGGGMPVDVEAARAATPGWSWRVAGGEHWMSRDQVWESLCCAEVVVTHAGQGSVAEVAAARARAVVVADPRPFDEQRHTVAALRRLGLGVPLETWPAPEQWPDLLDRACATDGERWRRWSTGEGAAAAARVVEQVAAAGPEPA